LGLRSPEAGPQTLPARRYLCLYVADLQVLAGSGSTPEKGYPAGLRSSTTCSVGGANWEFSSGLRPP